LLDTLTLSSFFTAPAPSESYPLSLHDALPILVLSDAKEIAARARQRRDELHRAECDRRSGRGQRGAVSDQLDHAQCAERSVGGRSEEHTSELQSLAYLVCRLLLEKKKKKREKR